MTLPLLYGPSTEHAVFLKDIVESQTLLKPAEMSRVSLPCVIKFEQQTIQGMF